MRDERNNSWETQTRQWAKLLAKAWTDPALMGRLHSRPEQVMKEFHIEMTPGTSYKIVENTPRQHFIVLPEKPSDLSEENLRRVVGGNLTFTHPNPFERA